MSFVRKLLLWVIVAIVWASITGDANAQYRVYRQPRPTNTQFRPTLPYRVETSPYTFRLPNSMIIYRQPISPRYYHYQRIR